MSLCRTCPRRAACSRPCPALEKYLRGAVPHGTRGPAHPPDRAELAREMRRRLAELTNGPQRLRTIARLYYSQGLTQREIARTLQVPRSTVASRLAMVRKRLERLGRVSPALRSTHGRRRGMPGARS